MGFEVAAPYTIYVPRPVPLHTTVAGDSDQQSTYDFYPDYWESL